MNIITRFFAALAIASALLVAPATISVASAETPVECQPIENYYLAVISNYQNENDALVVEVQYWKDAHDRVVANAVERNIEFAAVVAERDALNFKVSSLRDKIKELRQQLKGN